MAEVLSCQVLVIGAGPGGLSAVKAAARAGKSVVLVDENPAAGGQIWRKSIGPDHPHVQAHLASFPKGAVRTLFGTTVFDLRREGSAAGLSQGHRVEMRYEKLILATGARERFLPFPGWTLPGVFGVGGLQALVKQGFDVTDKRVVIAGSGPLLLEVARTLKASGAKLAGIFEQAPSASLRRMALELRRQPKKWLQAAGFAGSAFRLRAGWWVTEAEGTDAVSRITLTNGTRREAIDCDLLACAYGLVPNLDSARLLGCRIEKGFVSVDSFQRTSIENTFAVGELVAIGGVEAARVQGTLAGLAAAGDEAAARSLFGERDRAESFTRALAECFALRDELRRLARPDTVICRCEDVRLADLAGFDSALEAKLQARVGMGPCQGRVCGALCQTLFNWELPTVRPPLAPVPLVALAESPSE